MNLYHIVLNNLYRRKGKMLIVLFGLIIGTSTMVSVYSVVRAMEAELTRHVGEFGINTVITPDAGGLTFSYGGITLPQVMYDVKELTNEDLNQLEGIRSRDMIRVIAPKLIGMKELEPIGTSEDPVKKKVIVVGAKIAEEFSVKPWLRIAGDNEASIQQTVTSSEKEQPSGKMDFEVLDLSRQVIEMVSLSDNQALIGYTLANATGLKKGERITLGGHEIEISGILLESGSVEDEQILLNLPFAQQLLNRPNELTVIEMGVDYSRGSEEALITEITEALPYVSITSLRQETLRRNEILHTLIRFGVTISAIVLLIGALVVGLTMSNSVRERTREIGIFRALGFRKASISKMIVTEGVIVSFCGGILGFFIGMLMARFAGPILSGMNIQVNWSFSVLVLSLLLSVTIGVISSLYPAYKASKQDPAEALRFI